MDFHPDYDLQLVKTTGYGVAGLGKTYHIDAMLQGDVSLPTAGDVGKASFVLGDARGYLARDLDIQPNDIVRLLLNSMWKPSLAVAWTGLVDSAVPRFDTQNGPTFNIAATTPYKQWDTIPFAISNTLNDAQTLAFMYAQGISAQDLITFSASRVKYPGPLGSLNPSPAGLQFSGTQYAGLYNYTLPDNMTTDPDLQKWSTILNALTTDTGMECYFDEFGSLVFRPLGYLKTPSGCVLQDIEIIDLALGVNDEGIITEVRVAPFQTYTFQQYAIATAPAELEDRLGKRIYTASDPWLNGHDAADFLAKSLLSQYASGLARGQVTILVNPAVRAGSVIQLPNPVDSSGSSLVYVTSKTYSLQWGGAWVETDTLSYGRDPRVGLPLAHAIPTWTGHMTKEQLWAGTSLSSFVNAQGETYYKLVQDKTLKAASGSKYPPCTGPWPVGTIIQVYGTDGSVLPGDTIGGYEVVSTTAGSTVTLPDNSGEAKGTAVVIKLGDATSPATTPTNQTKKPPTSSPIPDASLQAFVTDYTGKQWASETVSGTTVQNTGQCVALVNLYCRKQLGLTPPPTTPNSQLGVGINGAGNMFVNASIGDWVKIPAGTGLYPQPGDVVVFGPDASNLNDGHVDICVSAGTSAGFQGFDENWADGTQYGVLPHQVWHAGYGDVIGWLHPLSA